MEIVNVRIDERLIHGQVARYWTTSLNLHRIMIIDDMAASDDIQQMSLRMATLSTMKLSIFSVATAIEKIKENPYSGERVFIVMKDPETLRRLCDGGVKFPSVNVGNMSCKHGSVQIRKSVEVTKSDVEHFEYCAKNDISFYAQVLPSDTPVEFISLLKDLNFDK